MKCHLISRVRLNDTSQKATIGARSYPPALIVEGRFDVSNVWRTPVSSVSHLVETIAACNTTGVMAPSVYDESTGLMIHMTGFGSKPTVVDAMTDDWSAPCFRGSEFHGRVCAGVATDFPPWDKAELTTPSCCRSCLDDFKSKAPWNGQPDPNQQIMLIGPLVTTAEP